MKLLKKQLLYLPFAAILFVTGCTQTDEGYTKNPVVKPDADDVPSMVRYLFGQERSLKQFNVHDGQYHIAFFDDNSYVLLDTEKYNVFETSVYEWPAVTTGNGNVWNVNGEVTSKFLTLDAEESDIVAVVYDGEGLYFRFSDSRIYYFHYGRTEDIGCYRFEKALNPQLGRDIICHVNGWDITGLTPSGCDLAALVPTVAYRGEQISAHDNTVLSGITSVDHSSTFRLTVKGAGEFYVNVATPRQLPVISIAVDSGKSITSQSTYVNATIVIDNTSKLYDGPTLLELRTEIRGRGNSTWWNMPKKPYKLKLANKTSILGMTKNKHWVLLANYSDKSLMRNQVVFEMSRIMGMRWTPAVRHVEVYVNNSYQGVYMLVEHTQVAEGRVDIDIVTENDNSGDALTGGYLFEIDERNGEPRNFKTTYGLPVNFKEPEQPTTAQFNYAQDYFKKAESTLYGADFKDPDKGYAQYIELRSFAQNYIIQELSKNVDGGMRLSTYMIKERGEKLAQSHVWDFDLALGNCDYINTSTSGFMIKSSRWHSQLMKDPAFVEVVKEEWAVLYAGLPGIIKLIRENEILLDEAQKRNFNKWKILNQHVWPNAVVTGSYKGEVDYMADFLEKRAEWLDSAIRQL